MAFDDNEITWTDEKTTTGSGNSATTNTATLNANLTDVGNTDNSVDGSGNTDLSADGSFHDGSHNEDWDLDHSGNTGSYNEAYDLSDNSVDDHSDNSVNDDSVHVGNRSYEVGFGGAAGAAGGNATIVDQSLNANVDSGGGVKQWVSNEAVIGSGDGAMAAGGDIDIYQDVDRSTNIEAGGDVNLDNTTEITTTINSGNTYTDNSQYSDSSTDTHIEDSLNDYSETWTANTSFNEEFEGIENDTWNIDADVIWGSDTAAIADSVDVTVDLPPM